MSSGHNFIVSVYITDPLNVVLKQNLMKACLSKLFSVKFLKDVLYIFISNNIAIHLNNCHSSPLNSTGYLLNVFLFNILSYIWVRDRLVANMNYIRTKKLARRFLCLMIKCYYIFNSAFYESLGR